MTERQDSCIVEQRIALERKDAEIARLRAAIQDIADMQDDEWNEVKYHAMRDWAKRALEQVVPK
jgi:hypothetical protein